jgi:5-methyltetrahydrofolate--homocysteine methyltransferase
MENDVKKLCEAGVKIAREAAGKKTFVAASVGPLGQLIKPLGSISFDEAYKIFREVTDAFKTAKPDILLIETMMDIQEARAALLAAKETGIPVIVTMTFENGQRTTTGTSPDVAAIVLSSMGALAIGANCSTGPKELIGVVQNMRKVTDTPIPDFSRKVIFLKSVH